jgi:hypothetical protein
MGRQRVIDPARSFKLLRQGRQAAMRKTRFFVPDLTIDSRNEQHAHVDALGISAIARLNLGTFGRLERSLSFIECRPNADLPLNAKASAFQRQKQSRPR